MSNKIEQAVILMAGLGTRFLPATKAVAKELFPIENKPALMFHLKELYDSGIKKVCIVLSKNKRSVKKFLRHDKKLEKAIKNTQKSHFLDELNDYIDNMKIDFAYQRKLNGTGGAVLCVKKWAENKPFLLLFGDDVCINENFPVSLQLCKAFEQTQKCVVGAKMLPDSALSNYACLQTGRPLQKDCFELLDIVEKPKNPPSNLVGLARYALSPEIFDELEHCEAGTDGEIKLTDAIKTLSDERKACCLKFDGKYYDCGNKLEFVKCTIDHALNDADISQQVLDYVKNLSKDE